jgi:hypothetical protein
MRVLRFTCGLLFLAVGLQTTVAQAYMTHRYSFNNGTANDSLGGLNGTLVNGATVSGGNLVFNPLINDGLNSNIATGQYVFLPGNPVHSRNFTIETWVTYQGGNQWMRIVDFGNSVPNGNPPPEFIGQGFLMIAANPTYLLGQISLTDWGGAGDTDAVFGGSGLPIGSEHQVAYVHNLDAGVEQLFLDGQVISTSTASGDPSTTDYHNFYIGRSMFSWDPFFHGSIDELRTYDNALSPAQVQFDAQAGPNGALAVAPEPASIGMLGASTLGLLLRRRRA